MNDIQTIAGQNRIHHGTSRQGRGSASRSLTSAIGIICAAWCLTFSSLANGQSEGGQFIENGEEVLSTVQTGAFATYEFEVAVPSTIRVSVGETNSIAEPFLQVIDPNGNTVGTDGSTTDALVQVASNQTGMFTAVVSDSGGDEQLSFRIRALTIPGDPLLIGGRDAFLENGSETVSSVAVGAFAIFPFDVEVAGTVRVSVGEINSGAEPVLEVFDTNGDMVGSDSSITDGLVQFTTNQSGRFTAVVSEGSGDELLDFRVRVLTVPGNPVLIAGRDAELGNGDEAVSTIAVGAFAIFPFDVDATGTVRVSVGEINSGAEPFLQVFDTNGDLVGIDSSTTSGLIQFTTSQTGTFTAVVSEGSGDELLDFRVRILTIPGNPSLIPGRDALLVDSTQVVSTVPVGTFAVFPFQIGTPGTVLVSVGETNTVAEPFLDVFDRHGDLVASNSSTTNAMVQFFTLQTGTFTAIVSDSGGDEPLAFSIIATGISDDPPPLLGDVNGDGVVDLLDVAPFVDLLTGGGFQPEADINQDGVVNLLDIAPFVQLLTGG